MDTLTIFLGITGALISWVILYYVVKAAVKTELEKLVLTKKCRL